MGRETRRYCGRGARTTQMRRRKPVIALAAAAVFGLLVVPASAELHRVTVTLVTGEQQTMTVDVPPGSTVQSIEIPGLPAPVQSIEDLGPVETPTPEPSASPTATATPDDTPTPTPTAAPPDPPQQPSGGGGSPGVDPAPTATPDAGSGSKGGKPTPNVGDDRAAANPNAEALRGALEGTVDGAKKHVDRDNPTRHTDGSPTLENPTVSLATPGPAPIGVPNFFIEKFRIPPFLLPIYQAAGIEYGVRWEVLAAINEIETDYGRNLNVSYAGALGWMQFMPATWDMYGVDANGDGQKDPFNPVDAIFAAARYLRAAGADQDLYRAIFAYNHADWYVESVLMRARVIGGLPADLVGSLTGLAQGRFPVAAKATYAGALPDAERAERFEPGTNAAHVVESDGTRRDIRIFSRQGAPVVAVNDGRISRLGHSRRLGNFVELQDSYGNTYRYSGLGRIAKTFPFPRERRARKGDLALPESGPAPKGPASRSTRSAVAKRHGEKPAAGKATKRAAARHSADKAAKRSGHAAAPRHAKAPVKERIS